MDKEDAVESNAKRRLKHRKMNRMQLYSAIRHLIRANYREDHYICQTGVLSIGFGAINLMHAFDLETSAHDICEKFIDMIEEIQMKDMR